MDSDRIKGSAREFGGRLEAGVGAFAGDDPMLAEGRVRQAAGASQALYGQAKDGLRDAVDLASDFAEQAYDQGSRYMEQGSRQLNARVESNPLTAIVIAGAIGYLLGLMARRR